MIVLHKKGAMRFKIDESSYLESEPAESPSYNLAACHNNMASKIGLLMTHVSSESPPESHSGRDEM